MSKFTNIEKNRSLFFFENTYDNSYEDNENIYTENIYADEVYTEEDYIKGITSMEYNNKINHCLFKRLWATIASRIK